MKLDDRVTRTQLSGEHAARPGIRPGRPLTIKMSDTSQHTRALPLAQTGRVHEDRPAGQRRRGELRIYLGAAPGVGKTFAMLGEARRRRDRGTDVVVGLVETHGRQKTAELLEGLEIVPRRRGVHRGHEFTELDTDAVLARKP